MHGGKIKMFRAISVVAAALAMASPAMAQQRPDHHEVMAAQAEAMAPFAWMTGKWRGNATQQGQEGAIELIQTERVGPMLSGSVMVVEGRGYDPATGEVQFNALGIISYDPATQSYGFDAHANGERGQFVIELVQGGFNWFIKRGPAKIRYEVRPTDGRWIETGFIAMAGREEMQFYHMELDRIRDDEWPLAGYVPMED